LVALATTRSAPSDSGCCPSGVAVVLSTTSIAPRSRHVSARLCRSTTSRPGFDGVSASTTSALEAASMISAHVASTTLIPCGARYSAAYRRTW
jgi:hypothetical protein